MSVSKTLEEVWRWKEEVARDTEGMSVEEQTAFFRQARERLAKKIGREINVRQMAQQTKVRDKLT